MTEPSLVSVVTPVHNGEPYLRECVESVLAQTYPKATWEKVAQRLRRLPEYA